MTHNACFNIMHFEHLLSSTGIYIKAPLNHMSLIPTFKGAPRDRQQYVMQVKCLCRETTRFPQCLMCRMCWAYILVVNIQFNKQCTKITCPVLYARQSRPAIALFVSLRLRLHERGFILIWFHDFKTAPKLMRFGSVYTEPFSYSLRHAEVITDQRDPSKKESTILFFSSSRNVDL